MKLTVPFAYRAEVLFPRASGPKEEVFVETFDVDVPELSSGDLGEALRYRDGRGQQSVFLNDQVFLEFAYFGGIGRVPITDISPAQGKGAPDEALVNANYDRGSTEHRAVRDWYLSDTPKRSGRDPGKVREWLRSDRDDAFRKVESFYRNMVALDGSALLACEEPKIISPTRYLCTYDIDFSSDGNVPGHPLRMPAFNMLDYEDAYEDSTRREPDWELVPDHVAGTIEIIRPEAFTFDRGRHALRWAAAYLFETLCKDIRRLPDAAMTDWIALRSLVNDPDHANPDQSVVDIVERCTPLARNGHTRSMVTELIDTWADQAVINPMGQQRNLRTP